MAAAASPDDEVARTLTIRRRLAISGLLVLLLFALNLGVTLWSAARRDHALADLHQTLARRALLDALERDLVARAREASVTRHLQLDDAQADAVQARLHDLAATVTALQALTPSDASSDLLTLAAECARLQALWTQELDASRLGGSPGESPEASSLLQATLESVRRASATERTRAGDITATLRRVSHLGTQLGTASFLVSLGFGAAVTWFLWARVARALRALIDGARRIGAGDLCHRIALHSRDELGEVADAFNDMSASLRLSLSEAEAARAEAERANRARSAFLAGLTHDLRTPMTSILGYLDLARDAARDAGLTQVVDDLDEVEHSSRHMLTLVNELLDLARVESGRMTLHVETFHLPSLVDEVVRAVGPLAARQGNEMLVDAAAAPDTMTSDPTKLRQTLFNLLGNAAKFTRDGVIGLTVAADGAGADAVVFAVRDTGVGIPRDRLERIFEEFDQGDPSIARTYGGTGLGLALSRRFCRMMGGDIEVTSAQACGTVFTVRLPRTVDAVPALMVVDGGARGSAAEPAADAATA